MPSPSCLGLNTLFILIVSKTLENGKINILRA